jgi:hypothetical protein
VSEVAAALPTAPSGLRAANVGSKAALVLLVALALLYPDSSHLRDKAAGARAIGYPALAFALPVLWWSLWRERFAFPWLPDLLVTLTCFTDILGNRMDLYDQVRWFDDWMHFMNTGLLVAAVLMLTMDRHTSRAAALERGLAFGATAAIAWELAEYVAFISASTEKRFAYEDTLGDLALGTLGAVVAVQVVHALWQRPESPVDRVIGLSRS